MSGDRALKVIGGASALSLAGLVLARGCSAPVETYGDSGAGYIEHLARLQVFERLTQAGGGPIDRLVSADGLYPPGLHLWSLPFAILTDHAPSGTAWLGLCWLALLAVAVAGWARGLGAGPRIQVAGAVLTLLTPALHAVAPRYYYDLPMVALLWAGCAVLLNLDRRPLIGGAAAGLLFTAAALTKWSALPFGVPLVAAVGWVWWRTSASRRVWAGGALAGGIAAALLLGFLAAGSTSFGAMSGVTFQPPAGTSPAALGSWLAATLPAPVGPAAAAMAQQLAATDTERVLFYPTRLVTTVLSPIMAAPLFGFAVVGLTRQRGAVAALIALGHLMFLTLLPPTDERFLLATVPLLPLLAALGWGRCPGRLQVPLAAAVAAVGVAVAADFHARPSAVPLHTDPQARPAPELTGHRWSPRLGLSTSIDQRGWTRSDQRARHRGPLREALWATLTRCRAAEVAGPEALLTAWGDLNWWAWRRARARTQDPQGTAPRFHPVDGPDPQPVDPGAIQLQLRPDPPDAFGGAPPPGPRWRVIGRIEDPQGGPHIALYTRPGSGTCPADISTPSEGIP